METNFLHTSRAIFLSLFDEIHPSTIPNHYSPISAKMQSLKRWAKNALDDDGNEIQHKFRAISFS